VLAADGGASEDEDRAAATMPADDATDASALPVPSGSIDEELREPESFFESLGDCDGMILSMKPRKPSRGGGVSEGGLAIRCCRNERKARMYAVEWTVSRLLCVAPSIHAGGSG